jgi:extracellular factor (EF) 3-hydroxypalmitic acid methyl ester biosynthesis protein
MALEIVPQTASSGPLAGDRLGIIYCRNSQGAEVRGTMLRLTRHTAVFEVYNPYSILQLSEVLSDFQISVNERTMYSGRAVISNLVNAGIMLILEAALEEDGWRDVDVFNPLRDGLDLRAELAEFLRDSTRIFRVEPEFKVVVSDIQSILTDLRRWMEQVEFGVRSLPTADRNHLELQIIRNLEEPVVPVMLPLMRRFEQIAGAIPPDLQPLHRSYIKRQLHPLVLCAPFVYRTFAKPLGYAGDYEMVSMMLRDPYEGSTTYAKLLNKLYLEIPPVIAHRNRITYLVEQLCAETGRAHAEGRRAQVFNLGCGPAQEVQRFIKDHDICDEADLTLLDFNDETIENTSRATEENVHLHQRRTGLSFVKKSVQQVMKESVRSVGSGGKTYDLVYCAGLFDYLSDRICRRLLEIFYDMLAPGGLLIATNVHPSNDWRNWMEYLAEWHLVYRDEAQFLQIAPSSAPAENIRVIPDTTGVNIFLEVRKPVHPA